MLMLSCPCGHKGPLPEVTGRYVCSKCGKPSEFTWFGGPQAFAKWTAWTIRTGRITDASAVRASVQFIPVAPAAATDRAAQ